jgi:hypothetical protein
VTSRYGTPRVEVRADEFGGGRESELDDLTQPGVESEEIGEASETGWEEGQGGDDDEIADWLAAESELRQRDDAGRQRRPKWLEGQAPSRGREHHAGEHTGGAAAEVSSAGVRPE